MGETARPAPLSDDSLFEARTEKVTFCNPPGYDMYGASQGKKPGDFWDWNRSERRSRWQTQDGRTGMAVSGRPVK